MTVRRARARGAAIAVCASVVLGALGNAAASADYMQLPATERSADQAPATIDPELLEASTSAGKPAAPKDIAVGPSLRSADLQATGISSERTEIIVRFKDPGVVSAAVGDTEAAVISLKQREADRWEAANKAISSLEHDGSASVIKRFWVTGAILFDAQPTEETLAALAALPGATEVIPNFAVTGNSTSAVTPSSQGEVSQGPDGERYTWGLEKIGAPDVWADFGVTGEGVRVAVLDSGIDPTHPDIAGRLVGADLNDPTYPGGWMSFDATGAPIASTPSDPGSHGTHVAGTIVGGDASGTSIGVAPGAKLMAANILSGAGGGSYARVLAGLEWALAPYSGKGVDDRVGEPANIINLSMGDAGHDEAFIDVIRNIRAAGVFPAIAIGNAPCGPSGNSSPGDIYEAVGVGMTNSDDEVDATSCGAQTAWPEEVTQNYGWPEGFVKPDVSAPGTAVYSAIPGEQWGLSTGTSMATPHVAGTVALMQSARAGLTVEDIAEALESTAWHPDGPGAAPDARYGHGRIDAHAAVSSVMGASGVSGTVVNAQTGEVIEGADVSYAEVGERWTSASDGTFRAPLVPGSYTLSVERLGFRSTDIPVEVTDSRIERVSIELEPLETGVLAGTVVRSDDGAFVPNAIVGVVGMPLSATTQADGSFQIEELPPGNYSLSFEAEGMRTAISEAATVKAGHSTRVNATLGALPNVLFVGGGDSERSAQTLSDAEFLVTKSTTVPTPDDLAGGDIDVVVFDSASAFDAASVEALVEAASETNTGIVWLDLGASDTTGIAALVASAAETMTREGIDDRSAAVTGYRVVADHPIFAGGSIAGPIAAGDLGRVS